MPNDSASSPNLEPLRRRNHANTRELTAHDWIKSYSTSKEERGEIDLLVTSKRFMRLLCQPPKSGTKFYLKKKKETPSFLFCRKKISPPPKAQRMRKREESRTIIIGTFLKKCVLYLIPHTISSNSSSNLSDILSG